MAAFEEENDEGEKDCVYSIKYDDGAEEKAAQRGMIKIHFEADDDIRKAAQAAKAEAEAKAAAEVGAFIVVSLLFLLTTF